MYAQRMASKKPIICEKRRNEKHTTQKISRKLQVRTILAIQGKIVLVENVYETDGGN